MDLRSRVVSLEHQHTSILQRVGDLERGQRMSDIEDAKRGEQWRNIVIQFEGLVEKIDGLNNNIKWVVKLVIGGLIAGLVAFIINGGFARAQETATAILETTRPIVPAARPLVCPSERPMLVRAYCRAPAQRPWSSAETALAR
jgi:hypothetical protein